jgi:Topoisomerase II-associated protein PAT1
MSVSTLVRGAKFDSLGRDFDFFGKTAKIADVMEEEQMTYARSHGPHQPPPTQVVRQTKGQQLRQQQQQPPQQQPQQPQQKTDYVRSQIQRQSYPPARAVRYRYVFG